MSNSKEGGRVGVFTLLFNQYREVNIPSFELNYLTYIICYVHRNMCELRVFNLSSNNP
jgi:hypothetical protein